jgi:hypothetical protein
VCTVFQHQPTVRRIRHGYNEDVVMLFVVVAICSLARVRVRRSLQSPTIGGFSRACTLVLRTRIVGRVSHERQHLWGLQIVGAAMIACDVVACGDRMTAIRKLSDSASFDFTCSPSKVYIEPLVQKTRNLDMRINKQTSATCGNYGYATEVVSIRLVRKC